MLKSGVVLKVINENSEFEISFESIDLVYRFERNFKIQFPSREDLDHYVNYTNCLTSHLFH